MEQLRIAMSNICMNYMPQEEDHLVDNYNFVQVSDHILFSLAILKEDGDVDAVNRYLIDLLGGEGYHEFEGIENYAPKEELLKFHIGIVVNYYMHDEEKDFKEQADFTDRDAFNSLIKEHNLYDLAVLNEGDLESVNKYFNDIWEENKN